MNAPERHMPLATALTLAEPNRSAPLLAIRFDSPIGPLSVAVGAGALQIIEFEVTAHAADRSRWQWRELPEDVDPSILSSADDLLLHEARRQLLAYLRGEQRRFHSLPLAPRGTAFQRSVWQALLAIPYGHTCSYGDLARHIGKPQAMRAVGAANGRNPLPLIIPCHRVIGADGSLTGFGGGLPIKKALLELEGVMAPRRRPA